MSRSLKEFEKFMSKHFYLDWRTTAGERWIAKQTWKAAMEQVLLWGSDDDTLFNKIKDEIYGE